MHHLHGREVIGDNVLASLQGFHRSEGCLLMSIAVDKVIWERKIDTVGLKLG